MGECVVKVAFVALFSKNDKLVRKLPIRNKFCIFVAIKDFVWYKSNR